MSDRCVLETSEAERSQLLAGGVAEGSQVRATYHRGNSQRPPLVLVSISVPDDGTRLEITINGVPLLLAGDND